MTTTLLVDGDQYLYRCCSATERDIKFDEENHVLASNEEEAWDTLQSSLRDLAAHFGNADIAIAMGSSPYFRHDIFPDYKAGRSRKPLCFYEVRERMQLEYRCIQMPGIEADDVMGILATKPGNDTIMVARDKDMRCIPAKLWDGKDFRNISEAEANRFHMYQTLTGDTSDGYKGCPGIGPKTAEKILDGDGPVWPRIVAAYEKAGLTAADALLQARLARILRWSDWDSESKKPKLWTPPGDT